MLHTFLAVKAQHRLCEAHPSGVKCILVDHFEPRHIGIDGDLLSSAVLRSPHLDSIDLYASDFGCLVEFHNEPLPALHPAHLPVTEEPSTNTHYLPHE
ncbi:hypothetical protein O3P69_009198 [Scylla paramamosain]|uniref:Uncharacterized protein n=1 Tax=Scylla paramamosain TaxID=85552 RepID=A0AAW0T9F1_SCYPA